MGQYHFKLPKMGESVTEATVTKWLKQVGDRVILDDPIVEIATDKVDTDVTSEVEGLIIEQRFKENDVVQVGETLLVIETKEVDSISLPVQTEKPIEPEKNKKSETEVVASTLEEEMDSIDNLITSRVDEPAKRFYSPLIKSISKKEGILQEELDRIPGTGKNQRLTKSDLLDYIKNRPFKDSSKAKIHEKKSNDLTPSIENPIVTEPLLKGQNQILEMTRMEKLVSEHMKSSLETSAHVQSFIEADVTDLWDWREKEKETFLKRENEKLTFTPLFVTAIIKALRDYPMLNSSLENDKIIIKKEINIGMATALPDGNLIVPVIKNADHLNLVGLTKAVNDLANRARKNQLIPEEVQEGTYTFTNIGNFGSIMGTPIINQPQVGILAIGIIRKMPSVIETPNGDFIGVRRKVILSHSYDHRIINGATGGLFVKRVAEYLENWNENSPF
jgi:2-oxoglutarate dehydrogenase E2 component (dihydrolipoamide succinyltransferase)